VTLRRPDDGKIPKIPVFPGKRRWYLSSAIVFVDLPGMNKCMTIFAYEGAAIDLLFLKMEVFAAHADIPPTGIREMEVKYDDIVPIADNTAFFTSTLFICDDLDGFIFLLDLVSAGAAFVDMSIEMDTLFQPVQTLIFPRRRGRIYTVHQVGMRSYPRKTIARTFLRRMIILCKKYIMGDFQRINHGWGLFFGVAEQLPGLPPDAELFGPDPLEL
jgi:hypothetical protein